MLRAATFESFNPQPLATARVDHKPASPLRLRQT
jgi:hypothetical protein